ncbi:hypothetical protein GW17_00059495 [Ensete ventricosum]|nr:hypothetical protein GW17_00059495 [Ensete ventricosum]
MHLLRFPNSGIRAKLVGTAASGALARDDRRWPAHKRLPTAHPQGAIANGQPGRGCPWRAHRVSRPLAGRLPVATRSAVACAGAATTVATQMRARGLGYPFTKRTILPL